MDLLDGLQPRVVPPAVPGAAGLLTATPERLASARNLIVSLSCLLATKTNTHDPSGCVQYPPDRPGAYGITECGGSSGAGSVLARR